MTTASTSTVLDCSSDAGFRTLVAEIILQLVTTCGVTQTADTGQINTSTVTRAASNTAAGYSIFRFNDTLQATVPVFIKLEYGTGASLGDMQMWITTGSGSNGSGTITGLSTTRVTVCNGQAATNAVTSFTSRYVYNSTFGYLGMAWKQNANSGTTVNGFFGGFVVCRSNDTTGAANGDAIIQVTNNSTAASGSSSTNGFMQCLGIAAATAFPASLANGAFFYGSNSSNAFPFALTSSVSGGNSYTVPAFYMTPIINVSAFIALPLLAEAAIGSTFTETLVGSTSITFLSCGCPFGGGTILGVGALSFCLLWQ